MKLRGNAGYGQLIASAALASLQEEPESPRTRTWLDLWTKPGPVRDRMRRWLSLWLKNVLHGIPADQAARYLEEMADDLKMMDTDIAVDLFIDKILPKIRSNDAPE